MLLKRAGTEQRLALDQILCWSARLGSGSDAAEPEHVVARLLFTLLAGRSIQRFCRGPSVLWTDAKG